MNEISNKQSIVLYSKQFPNRKNRYQIFMRLDSVAMFEIKKNF